MSWSGAGVYAMLEHQQRDLDPPNSPVTRGLDHASRIYPTCAVNFRTRVNPSSDGPSFFAKLLEHIFVRGWIAGSSPAMTRRGRSLQALRSPAGLTTQVGFIRLAQLISELG